MNQVIEKAGNFVEKKGNALQKAALNYILSDDEESCKKEVEKELTRYQNEDGGFSNGLEIEYAGNISSPFTTAAALGYIYFFGLKDSDIMKRTERYLIETQKNDGSWDDEDGILEFDIPPYMGPGIYVEYKTAMILKWLRKLGIFENSYSEKSLKFLVDYFDTVSDKKDFWSAAAYVSLFSELPENENSEKILKWGMEILSGPASASENTDIQWEQVQGMIYEDSPMLASIKDLVSEKIKMNQLPDGSWPHQFGDYNAVWAAILICRFLVSNF